MIALSTKGDSAPSIPYTDLLAFSPEAPLNLVSINTNAEQIGLSWFSPDVVNGAEVNQFKVYWRNEGTCLKKVD